MKDALRDRGLLSRIALPPTVDALLTALLPDAPVPAGHVRGTVQLGVNEHPLGFIALDLKPPGPSVPYHLVSDADSFRFWLILSQTPPAKKIFSFATGAAGAVLKPATPKTDGKLEWLEAAPGDVSLTGVEATLDRGQGGRHRDHRPQPDGRTAGGDRPARPRSADGAPRPAPGSALEELPQADWDRDSADGRAGGPDDRGRAHAHDRGRTSRPGAGSSSGRRASTFQKASPSSAGPRPGRLRGGGLVAERDRPRDRDELEAAAARGGWGFDVLIECRDPTATGLQDFIPTLVEAAMTLPLEDAAPKVDGQGFGVLAGEPVISPPRSRRSSADPRRASRSGWSRKARTAS